MSDFVNGEHRSQTTMENPPFSSKDQLCRSLIFNEHARTISRSSVSGDPPTLKTTLPGQGRIELHGPSIATYIEHEFLTPKLNQFAPYLWLVAKQDSTHISQLTHQVVRGRSIILTENPELHLTWIHDHIYIKPVPRYILSNSFWKYYLVGQISPIPETSREAILASVKGFLRSYAHLVRHKSDFNIALSPDNLVNRLLPKGIQYTEFIRFISNFEHIPDEEVSQRYAFGELRLSRLNLWSPLILNQLGFQKVYSQYGTYFTQFFSPLLFVWACFSVVLTAFQVLLASQPSCTGSSTGDWKVLTDTARRFAIATLVILLILVGGLLLLLAVMFFREFSFAIRDLARKKLKERRERKQIQGMGNCHRHNNFDTLFCNNHNLTQG